MTNLDKINIINQKIEECSFHINSLGEYIVKINNGMEDPDYSIEECNKIIEEMKYKIDILKSLKGLLTN